MVAQLKPIAARQIEARARALTNRARIVRLIDQQAYVAKSQTTLAEYHLMRDRSHRWTCECDGYRYTGCCYHLGQLERRAEREKWAGGFRLAPVARQA